MQKLRAIFSDASPIAITALISVLLLTSVTVARTVAYFHPDSAPATVVATEQSQEPAPEQTPEWQQQALLLGLTSETDANAATSTDHLSMIGPMIMGELIGSYNAVRANGDYTKDDLRRAAEKIAPYVKAAVSYEAFQNSDFVTTADASTERVRVYRDELQKVLEPLASIPGAEYEIYGRYVETSDEKYLTQLKDAADTYRSVAQNASMIPIPSDAVNYHREVLNSLRAFSSVLDGLADHADDPYASIALLRTYNEKEKEIYDSYNRMRSYYAKKAL